MSEYTLKLKDNCPKKLGTGPTAKKIFNKLNKYEKAIVNFEDIEFMSRSFAQEYISQKHQTKSEIIEINMNDSIRQLLELVKIDYEETFLR